VDLALHGVDRIVYIAIGRHHDHGRAAAARSQCVQHLKTTAILEVHVHQDGVDAFALKQLECTCAAVGFEHLRPEHAPQLTRERAAQGVFVVDDQDRVLTTRHGYILVW
jgi:hypothetical protein